jgi:O-antigen/teichoic acid export membrane protein
VSIKQSSLIQRAEGFVRQIWLESKSLLLGVSWVVVGNATSRLLHLVLMILIARFAGVEDFGQLGLALSTIGVIGLFAGMGLGSTVTKYLAQYARSDPERAGRIVSMIVFLTLVTLSSFSVLLFSFSEWLAATVFSSPKSERLLSVSALYLWPLSIRALQNGAFSGIERFDLVGRFTIIEGVLAASIAVLLTSEYGVLGAVLGLAIGTLLTSIVAQAFLQKEFKGRSISIGFVGSLSEIEVLKNFSFPAFISNIVAIPVLWFALVILGKADNGQIELGLYNAAYQWQGPLVFVPTAMMSVLMPKMVRFWEGGSLDQFRQTLNFGLLLTILLTMIPGAIMLGMADFVMQQYGEGFSGGVTVLILVVLAAPFHALLKLVFTALYSMNDAWVVFRVNLIWGLFLIIGAILIVPEYGAVGMASVFVAVYFVCCLVGLAVLNYRVKHYKDRLEAA